MYYQAGVGTGISTWDHFVGGGTGLGLSENIREAYSFLVDNYAMGDKIFLVGFSRGAYTARSIGGLISQLGLLSKEAMTYFYPIFLDWENAGNPQYTPTLPKELPTMSLDQSSRDFVRLEAYLEQYRKNLEKVIISSIAVSMCS